MNVLYPGDNVHLIFWYNPLAETAEEIYERYKPIFEAHGVNVYSHQAINSSEPFPPQIFIFRKQS